MKQPPITRVEDEDLDDDDEDAEVGGPLWLYGAREGSRRMLFFSENMFFFVCCLSGGRRGHERKGEALVRQRSFTSVRAEGLFFA